MTESRSIPSGSCPEGSSGCITERMLDGQQQRYNPASFSAENIVSAARRGGRHDFNPMPACASGARSSGDGNTWREPVPMMTTSGPCSRSRSMVEALNSSGLRSVKSVEVPCRPTMTVPVNVTSFTVTNPVPYAVIRCPLVVVESEWSFMSTPRIAGAVWNDCRSGVSNVRKDGTRAPNTPRWCSPPPVPPCTDSRVHCPRRRHSEGTGPEACVGSRREMTRRLRVRVRATS